MRVHVGLSLGRTLVHAWFRKKDKPQLLHLAYDYRKLHVPGHGRRLVPKAGPIIIACDYSKLHVT